MHVAISQIFSLFLNSSIVLEVTILAGREFHKCTVTVNMNEENIHFCLQLDKLQVMPLCVES